MEKYDEHVKELTLGNDIRPILVLHDLLLDSEMSTERPLAIKWLRQPLNKVIYPKYYNQ